MYADAVISGMFDPPLSKEMKEYGGVLQRADALLEADEGMKFGEAVRRAVEMADVEVPKKIQDQMLMALFRVTTGGFPSKVDA